MTPDVNVLVAAYRPDHPYHLPARAWLEDAASAVALSTTARHAPKAGAWRSEAARCLLRARRWLHKWERELRDPIAA